VITPRYVQTMAAYNAEMNRRTYAAARRSGEDRRRAEQGAFWKSIHGTLSHILWADQLWMSRFSDASPPSRGMAASDQMAEDFEPLAVMRAATDEVICRWAACVDATWLDSDLAWFSSVLNKEMRAPAGLLVTHFFNHQTHHRGQAHALLTRAGEHLGDTDLFLVVPPDGNFQTP
jgi:uncharacterized damage-inducible protein DinB